MSLEKQETSQRLKRDEHQNILLERERRRLEHGQRRLGDRVEHLTKQLKEKTEEHRREELKLKANQANLEKLQSRLMALNRESAKIIEMNHQ